MNRAQEKLLIAALAGLLIVSAAAFAVTPTLAAGYSVETTARVTGIAGWDVLNVRTWPASFSHKIGGLEPGATVWVERCISVDAGHDWCRIERDGLSGWVNSRYLAAVPAADMGDL